jgi:hypothetical protein
LDRVDATWHSGAPADPRRRSQDSNVPAAVGTDADQVDVDIGQPEKQ